MSNGWSVQLQRTLPQSDYGLKRKSSLLPERNEQAAMEPLRTVAEQALSRAAGAKLIPGNRVSLLKNARENYPAWLRAISAARHYIYFESYIIHEDATERSFAEALIAKAHEGVRVRLIYDWLGLGKSSRHFWNELRAGGVDVRCYKPATFRQYFRVDFQRPSQNARDRWRSGFHYGSMRRTHVGWRSRE
jgi:phosphatidylserine/phosphatidylglycerophosphate/cardiolipin synthase-like enzyme